MAKVLIVDDDAGAREILGRICEFRGHEVEWAADAQRAVPAYERFRPDLLVVDLAMPLGGGQQLVHNLREAHPQGICPVIVVSGYAAVLDDEEKEVLGAHAILDKPVQLQTMVDAMDGALGTAT